MDKPIVLYFSQVVLFSIFPFYFATIKTYFRNNLFYIYLGVVLGFGGLLGQVWAIQLTDTIRISGGNIAYAAFMMTSILFVVLEQDIAIARNIIKLVIVVNIFKYLLFNSIYAFLSNPQFINPNSVSPKVFSSSAAMMLVGGILIITELVLFLFVFEKIKKVSKQSFITILLFTIFFIILLCLDGILFPLINFRLFPDLSAVIIGGIKNKIVLGASFSPAMLFILIVFRKRFENYLYTDLRLKNILKKSKEDLALIVQEQFEEIKVSEEKYRTLYETMAQGVVYQDADGHIISANPAAELILGQPLYQMKNQTSESVIWKTINEDGSELPGSKHPSIMALKTGEPVKNTIMGVFNPVIKDYVWININAIPQFRKGESRPYQVYTTFEDITERIQIEKALTTNTDRYAKAQKMGQVGNWEYDIVTETFWGSEEAKRLFSLDQKVDSLSVEDVESRIVERDRVHQALEDLMEQEKPYDIEYEVYAGDNDRKTIIHSIAEIIKNESGNPIKIVGVVKDITQQKISEESLTQYKDQLSRLNAYLQNATEQERISIAREIHDDLGQTLSALKMDLGWIGKRLSSDQGKIIEKIGEMKALIANTVQSVKRLCSDLRPGLLDDLGLAPALSWYTDQVNERSDFNIRLTIDLMEFDVNKDLATSIYRIVQESLTNVSRHAQAENVWISLVKDSESIVLKVQDDGTGIDMNTIDGKQSFGIIGMRERVFAHDGKFEIIRRKERGTAIKAVFPLERVETL